MPARFMAGTKNSTASSGAVFAEAAEAGEFRGAVAPLDESGDEEEGGLHRDVVGTHTIAPAIEPRPASAIPKTM